LSNLGKPPKLASVYFEVDNSFVVLKSVTTKYGVLNKGNTVQVEEGRGKKKKLAWGEVIALAGKMCAKYTL
jgi:hypothetical protein